MEEFKPFLPLQKQLWESSIWQTPCHVRVVWITLLMLGNEPGRRGNIDMTPESIAARASVTLAEVTDALGILAAPDARSRSPDHDGRRIVLLDTHRDWGWKIVNWERYDEKRKNALHAERQRRYREKHPEYDRDAPVTHTVTPRHGSSPEKEKEKEKEKEEKKQTPLSGKPDASEFLYPEDFKAFWNAYPRKEHKGKALESWQAIKASPPLSKIILAIGEQKKSAAWKRDDGRYIPLPENWITGRCWENEKAKPAHNGETITIGKHEFIPLPGGNEVVRVSDNAKYSREDAERYFGKKPEPAKLDDGKF